MRGLDDYIMGTHIHFEDDRVKHVCPICGEVKYIPMFYELGGWFYPPEFEDDAYCKWCETEMIILD
jgi:hypothetical protein